MSHVVRYTVDGGAVVMFEVEPPEGFAPASSDQTVGRAREAIGPAVRAARALPGASVGRATPRVSPTKTSEGCGLIRGRCPAGPAVAGQPGQGPKAPNRLSQS